MLPLNGIFHWAVWKRILICYSSVRLDLTWLYYCLKKKCSSDSFCIYVIRPERLSEMSCFLEILQTPHLTSNWIYHLASFPQLRKHYADLSSFFCQGSSSRNFSMENDEFFICCNEAKISNPRQILKTIESNINQLTTYPLLFHSRYTPAVTSRISSSLRTTRKLEDGAARTPSTRTSAKERHVGSNHSVV